MSGAGGAAGMSGSGGARAGAGGAQAGIGGGNNDGGSDDVMVHDGSVGGQGGYAPGAYVRTSWTATYTCETPTTNVSACLRNGDSAGDTPSFALDGKYSTRWSTDAKETDLLTMNELPVYFTVDMKEILNVSKVLMQPGCKDDFDVPGTLEVYLSVDGTNFGSPLVTNHHPPYQGPSCGNQEMPPAATFDTITFPTTPARYIQIKMTQTLQQAHMGIADRYWAIGEFFAFP